MRITLLYNEPLPSRYHAVGEGAAIDAVLDSVRAVRAALTSKGHTLTALGLRPPLSNAVKTVRAVEADILFNLFEGFQGRPDTEWLLVRELESLDWPFTGARSETLALCLDKGKTKEVLMAEGVPTAPYQVLTSKRLGEYSLDFPVIVKPLREDASHLLNDHSVVADLQALRRQVCFVEERSCGPVLVESYLSGREFNLSILGGTTPSVLPPSEIPYPQDIAGPRILTYDAKWRPEHPVYKATMPVCPARVPERMRLELEDMALAAYRAIGSPPYARIDLRCDSQGQPHVLEVNPNPDLSPEYGLALQAQVAGLEYGELTQAIVEMALMRDGPNHAKLRPMAAGEAAELARITEETGFFRPDEVEVAREVLAEAASKGDASGYHVRVAAEGSRLLGYVCFGPTPMTRGTWDIYWLAVDPRYQRRGFGRRLMRLAESEISSNGGRLMVIETSSQELYEPTRLFHRSLGYQEVGRIPNFYDTGDDKITFVKILTSAGDHTGPP